MDKLDRAFDLTEYQNLRYGPSTPQGLQSFLIPTLPTVKCKDKFLNNAILDKLRVFTDILRICERVGLPKFYAEEAMRIIIKRNRGMFSFNWQVDALLEVLSRDSRLTDRVAELQAMKIPRKAHKQYKPRKTRQVLVTVSVR
jgi:hypothetical protein